LKSRVIAMTTKPKTPPTTPPAIAATFVLDPFEPPPAPPPEGVAVVVAGARELGLEVVVTGVLDVLEVLMVPRQAVSLEGKTVS
jgi:hypothetical protein